MTLLPSSTEKLKEVRRETCTNSSNPFPTHQPYIPRSGLPKYAQRYTSQTPLQIRLFYSCHPGLSSLACSCHQAAAFCSLCGILNVCFPQGHSHQHANALFFSRLQYDMKKILPQNSLFAWFSDHHILSVFFPSS